MFKFKIDVMKELHDRGITTYKIRTDNLFGQKTLAVGKCHAYVDIVYVHV